MAVWVALAAPPWAQPAALPLALPLPWRLRLLAIPLALPLLLPPRVLRQDGRYAIVVADVGEGTAVLLRTRTPLLLYDTGPQCSSESDAGRRVLLPQLRAGRVAHRPAGARPPRQRPRGRRCGTAQFVAGAPTAEFARSGAPLVCRWPTIARLRSLTTLGVGRGHVRSVAPTSQDYELDRKPNALSHPCCAFRAPRPACC